MNVNLYHTFALETRDREGRRWCRVCGLPENNARARAMHTIPSQRDWRDRAYSYDRDEDDRRAA